MWMLFYSIHSTKSRKDATGCNSSSSEHPSSYRKATSKGCDETPIKTGFEGIPVFVILWSR